MADVSHRGATEVVVAASPYATQLETIEDDIDAAEAAATALAVRVTTAEADIVTAEADIVAVETAAASLTARVTTAEGEVDTLQSDLDTAEATLALAATEADLTTAEGRITVNETDIAAIQGLRISVMDYGAVGDGSTDDTTACQDAIDAAEAIASGYGPVIVDFPAGAYSCLPLYVSESNIVLRGEGAATIIRYRASEAAGGATSLGVVNFHGLVGTRISDVGLVNIKVDGNKANVTVAGGGEPLNVEAVSFIYCDRPFVDRVWAINSVSEGIDFDECADGEVSRVYGQDNDGCAVHFSTNCVRMHASACRAYACGVTHTRPAFDVHSTATDCSYTDCHTHDCYRGFTLAGDFNGLANCSDYLSDANSFRIEGHHNTLVGCRSRGVTAGNGFTISGDFNSLTTCTATSASSHGITAISGALHNTFNACVARLNGSTGILLASGANSNTVGLCVATGNTSAQITDSGTSNALVDNKTT